MVGRLRKRDARVESRQGYSFVNHTSWFLTNAPRTTGVVGGDNFVRDMLAALAAGNTPLGGELAALIREFDMRYRRTLEAARFGNQVRFVVWK
jgi:hypothetical protein